MLQVLLTQKVDLASASNIACRVMDVIGPPSSYTVVVSALVGVAAVVFGVYTNTGKDWSKAIFPWKWGQSNTQNVISVTDDDTTTTSTTPVTPPTTSTDNSDTNS